MTDEEQKKIFAKNLNKYIQLNQKQQKEIADDLGINATTLNMWCSGKSIPKVSIIQKLADYFRIGKSDLIDERETDSEMKLSDALMKIAYVDKRFARIAIGYSELSADKKDLICEFFEKFIL